jgi:hypothetical protein
VGGTRYKKVDKPQTIQFHNKMTFGLASLHIQKRIPPKYESLHLNTSKSKNLSRRCRTNSYERSYLPSTLIVRNNLPTEIKTNPSISNQR